MAIGLNLTKQLFVATSYGEITASSQPGRIFAKVSGDGEDVVLKYVDVKGEQTRSDIINARNVMWVKSASAESQRDYINTWTVTLNSAINSGAVISGQDYILRVRTSNYYDKSDINEHTKYGVVHGFAGMTTAQFYAKMAVSLAKNFSKELDKPVKIFVGNTEITPDTDESDITGATSIIIKEAEPYWKRNSFKYSRYHISIEATTVKSGNDELVWANITKATSTTDYFGNGKKTADEEDFSLSLNGDYPAGITYQFSSETMVNPASEYNYLTIHHCHIGSNESPQKSEKDIVIVSTEKSVINSIITAINNATGKSFATLTTSSSGSGSGSGS